MQTQFPQLNTQRIAVKLKPKAEKLIKQGHPWVFSDAIIKFSKEAATGDLVILFDNRKDKPFAVGIYDKESPIRIKIISHTPALINASFFAQKITEAKSIRLPLFKSQTDSYRLIFGENDGLPSFIADVYANVLVVKIYSAMWWPYLNDIVPALLKETRATAAVLRLSRNVERIDTYGFKNGQVIYGELDSEIVIFQEHGLRFSANVIQGHKTGYFLDHRHNRKRVGELTRNKKVLDVFSYAGGFSVHALQGGAAEVTSVDISEKALEVATFNASLNTHQGKHQTIVGDAFEILEQMVEEKRFFDVVIIDPPSFAKSAKQVHKAMYQYERLAILGAQLIANKGLLVMASCSSRVTAIDFFAAVEKGIAQTEIKMSLTEKKAHDIDHKIGFKEGAYLKCGYWRRDK